MTELPPDAIAALENGRLIEAIKIVRDRTGLDLKNAKDVVERYANGERGELLPGGWSQGAPQAAATTFSMGDGALPAAALAALARGQKVEAVKIVREATGLSLAAAKKLVDDHQNPPAGDFGHVVPPGLLNSPMAEPGRVSGGGMGKWLLIIVVVLLAALAWSHFGAKG
jgi:ribosomal protein L7/L12